MNHAMNNTNTMTDTNSVITMQMNIKPQSDNEFLKDMIVHHQVAVDMSENLLKITKSPALIALANDIIRTQKYEIWLMKQWLHNCNFSQNSQKSAFL